MQFNPSPVPPRVSVAQRHSGAGPLYHTEGGTHVLNKWFGSLPFVMVLAIIMVVGSWLGFLMVTLFGSSSSTLVVGTFLGGVIGFSIVKYWERCRKDSQFG